MRVLALAAGCPTFLLGDFDSVNHAEAFHLDLSKKLPSIVADFVCGGDSACEVEVPALAPPPLDVPAPMALRGTTYRMNTAATDDFWNHYLTSTPKAAGGMPYAVDSAFEHFSPGCLERACGDQVQVCEGAEPCSRRLLRMQATNAPDGGLVEVYGSEREDAPLTWTDLSHEEHGLFSCALARCAEPRLAVVDGAQGQHLFLKRLRKIEDTTGERNETAAYERVAKAQCPGLLPVMDLQAKLQTSRGVFGNAVVMPTMDGTAAGWARSHSLEERAACAPALLQAMTQGLDCLGKHGLVHSDLALKQVMYKA